MSLRSAWRVGRRAIAGSSRWSACRGGRGCCGRLLLIVLLLAMRRLRCHGGHVCSCSCSCSCGARRKFGRPGEQRSQRVVQRPLVLGRKMVLAAVLSNGWARGTRACFSSRGLQMLQAARWQIGSGYGAVRTCKSSNWIGNASRIQCARRGEWLDYRRRWCRTRLSSCLAAPSHAL